MAFTKIALTILPRWTKWQTRLDRIISKGPKELEMGKSGRI